MKLRRTIAGILIVLGIVLMVFAPETMGGETIGGIALIVAGIIIEIVGIVLEKRG